MGFWDCPYCQSRRKLTVDDLQTMRFCGTHDENIYRADEICKSVKNRGDGYFQCLWRTQSHDSKRFGMADRKSGRNTDGTFGPGNPGKPKGTLQKATQATMAFWMGS